jgi:hypothetical protein
VRWAGPAAVFLASPPAGVYRVPLSFSEVEIVIPHGSSAGEFALPARLGSSDEFLAFASPIFTLGWKVIKTGVTVTDFPFAATTDVDVHGHRVAILGVRRGLKDEFDPAGPTGWVGSLAAGLKDLKAVYVSGSGRGAAELDACFQLETGAVRFLRDGGLVLASGVDPEVVLYDPAGKLVRSWQTRDLGFDSTCGLAPLEVARLSMSATARFVWLNKRVILDDIVDLPQGAGLLLRSRVGQETRWAMRVLKPDGSVGSMAVPITSPSDRTRLRGAALGERIVFLTSEYGDPPKEKSPPAHPRLIEAVLRP